MSKKLPTNEKMLELASSGKAKDIKKFIQHWAHAGRLAVVAESPDIYSCVQDLIDDNIEISTDHGAIEVMHGDEYFGLRVLLVGDNKRYDGEAFRDTYSVMLVTTGEVLTHFRIGGYYDSYAGIFWDGDVDIVKPYRVVITQYMTDKERKKSDAEFV